MKLRHEFKHQISYNDMLTLKSRLSKVMKLDKHTDMGKYFIRSLYFDNLYDKALREKIDGVDKREKFRIRYYNFDTSFIQLEKKSKINGLCNKVQEVLSKKEVEQILNGDIKFLIQSDKELLHELYVKMKTQGLMPFTIVDYTRCPYVFKAGNVRVTLDYNIRTGRNLNKFFEYKSSSIPIKDAPIILEVKWDEYLPDIIRKMVQIPSTRTTAFSKYAVCRMFG